MATIIKHPIINIKLDQLRNIKTNHSQFRSIMNDLAKLLIYPVLKNYETKKTPEISGTKKQYQSNIYDQPILLIPILRAGLGLLNGFSEILPEAKIGHIGLYRDENNQIKEYLYKLPEISKNAKVILLDPMLATGASLAIAIKKINQEGFNDISVVTLIASEPGIKYIENIYPTVKIFSTALDPILNEKGYIIPGLGDAGDRLFGTK